MALKVRLIAIAVIIVFACFVPLAQAHVPIEQTDPMVCGTWTWYAPGVMERVQKVRGLPRCEDCDGIVTTVDQRLLNGRIRIWYAGAWRGTFHVVDVGQPGKNRSGLVGEVPAEVAWSWGVGGPWWGCYEAG